MSNANIENNRKKWFFAIDSNDVYNNFQEVIKEFFIKDDISFEKYHQNQSANNIFKCESATPTFKEYYAGLTMSRGHFMPSWYYFAYPDVDRWYGDNIDTDIFKKHFNNDNFEDKYVEVDKTLSLKFFRIVINEFKLRHNKLECSVDENLEILKNRLSSEINQLFPPNMYISHILNDGLYLSPDDFEIKYSRVAKKIKNITKDFGNPSTKYTLKGGFFTDDEVIIYEKDSIQADIAVSHLSTDHTHWKSITNYLSSRSEFELYEDSGYEKSYVLQQDGYSLPRKVSFIRILCSIEGKIGIVVLNVNFR